jgi:hypothetical protein
MTAIDLIMLLSQLPPDIEVVYDNTQKGDEGFRLTVVECAEEIESDGGEKFILLNFSESDVVNKEDDE